jgi:hypothetical protein
VLIEQRDLRFCVLSLRFALGHAGPSAERLGLPAGVPGAIRLLPGTQEIAVDTPGGEVLLAADSLGTALIAYCLRVKIPLARRASKAVRIEADAVVLATRLEHEMPPEPAPPPPPRPSPVRQMVWGQR